VCNCITKANRELERVGSNTRIDAPFCFNLKTGKPQPPRCAIVTCKADSRNRERLHPIVATYCPLCGKKYTR